MNPLLIFLTTILLSPGEMGPAMLIVREPYDPTIQTDNTQSLQLHTGWNLVSWHIDPPDPDLTDYLEMQEILPDIPLNDWFFDNDNGKVYTWEDNIHYYPDHPGSEAWQWDQKFAYYLHLDTPHPWQFADRPLLTAQTFTIHPNSAWDDTCDTYFSQDPYIQGWFFMGYSGTGYTKVSSLYNAWPPENINGTTITYRGPFHWLYWDHEADPPHPHRGASTQYLVMVKSDDGRIYLPYDTLNTRYPWDDRQEFDEIGVLEPGKGYFLGFRKAGENDDMDFDGWEDYPGWPGVNSLQPGQTTQHFQFHPYTHWTYPVIIDTLDQAQMPMAPGDEIGVFDGDLCVGAARYSGHYPLKITCWKNDIATPAVIDGYTPGHEIIVKWFDASENQEIVFELPPTIMGEDDPIAPSHSGFGAGLYASRGMGTGLYVGSVKQLPKEFKLGQNYPNPFNAETIIPLELPQRSDLKIELFNVRGQSLGVIFNGVRDAGWPKIHYNASHLASGVYFCRVTAKGLERGGKYQSVGKLLLLK